MDADRPVGIVVPMEGELAPYARLLEDLHPREGAGPWEMFAARAGPRPVALVLSGPGPVNAAAATERLIAACAPAAVLHGGSAGAHDRDLLPGDLVVGARYVILTTPTVREGRRARGLHPSLLRFRRDGTLVYVDHLTADAALLARARHLAERELAAMEPWDGPGWPAATPSRPGRAVTGTIGSADSWTVAADELHALHADHGAACEDMESAYVAQVCALHGVPFLAVRAISDNEAVRPLVPADVLPAIAAAGERAARVLAALARET
jgi:nucleoside phosphorylase